MDNNVIGSIPEFTQDDAPSEEISSIEVSGQSPEETSEQPLITEKETPSDPLPDTQPAQEHVAPSEDITGLAEKLKSEIEGLKEAKKDLILELADLRGEKRRAKEEEIREIEDKVDDLKDLHPQDVELINRVFRAKGYVSQKEVKSMLYDARKQDELSKFLGEFREYNEENDPNQTKWKSLLKEVSLYKEPDDPVLYGTILRRAHKSLTGTQPVNEQVLSVKRKQVETASVGAGGTQRSSSEKSFDQAKRQRLMDGGWSEEDIKRMEQRQ